MLFCDRLSQQDVRTVKLTDRVELLEALLNDFRNTFPDLTFELQLDFLLVNAQALRLVNRRLVTIYGGLALHPRLGLDSLTFIVLHEVGHHLADGCRSRRDPLLACECAADHWAVTTGVTSLCLKTERRLQIHVAVEELDQVLGSGQLSKGGYIKSTKRPRCWAGGWPSRRKAILKQVRSPREKGCCISYI
jgi:hypothetical protein